jgi:hypothetical protein
LVRFATTPSNHQSIHHHSTTDQQIKDPEATKPEDWDENAPRTISDPAATKPEGWLDDEPATVADPQANMPGDW